MMTVPRFRPANRPLAVVVALLGLMAGGRESMAGEPWSRFRGPNGSGLAPDARIPETWTDADYNWRQTLPGVGHSSPVVWKDRLFVTSAVEATGERFVHCLDVQSGKLLWRRRFSGRPHDKHALNSLASSTPAVDEQQLYCCFVGPHGSQLLALDHDGGDRWSVELEPFVSGHGGGVSPIVEGELVVLAAEHQSGGSLIAWDRKTGQTRWRAPRKSSLHYATPCRLQRENGRVELIFTNWEQGVAALDPANGDTLWQADVFDKGHVESSIASPVVSGDLIVAVCGWLAVRQEAVAIQAPPVPTAPANDEGSTDEGSTDERSSDERSKQAQAKRLFTIDRGAPLCVTPLIKDRLLFLWADEGIVTCVEIDSGQVHWRRRVGGQFYCSPICVGERIYNFSTEGEAVCLAASREFKVMGRSRLPGASHATPAVSGGVMFLRTASEVLSLGDGPK